MTATKFVLPWRRLLFSVASGLLISGCALHDNSITVCPLAEVLLKVGTEVEYDESGRHGVDNVVAIRNTATFTDGDIDRLAVCKNLKMLCLTEVRRLTDRSCVAISKMTALEYLSVHMAHITDDGVSHLTALKRLNRLDISATQITDRSCNSLSEMTSLTELSVTDTHITHEGIAQIRAKNPNIDIAFDE
jgi:hypothetical protein